MKNKDIISVVIFFTIKFIPFLYHISKALIPLKQNEALILLDTRRGYHNWKIYIVNNL